MTCIGGVVTTKKFLCVVLLVCLMVSPAMANDKALHFGAGALVSYVGGEDGLLWAGVAGLAKECVDDLNGGRFDPMDMLATIGGGAVVQLARYGHLKVSDNALRTMFWGLSMVSCASVANQQRNGMYEVNPALTMLTGEHPSFGQVAVINMLYGIGAEYAYHNWSEGAGRWMWALGALMAGYWIAEDYNNGIGLPERTWRVSCTIARW